MKLLNDKIVMDTHDSYTEFEKSQVTIELAQNDIVEIVVNGTVLKKYTAKYINCMIDMIIQDKGEKVIL